VTCLSTSVAVLSIILIQLLVNTLSASAYSALLVAISRGGETEDAGSGSDTVAVRSRTVGRAWMSY
jgi:hypothetical protein